MVAAFINGVAPIITTRGPGKLHLLSYNSNGGLPNHVGTITTSNESFTRFMISHSYTFVGYAFYWEGSGEAVWTFGDILQRQPVGKSWSSASVVGYGGTSVASSSVENFVKSAVQRDSEVTCFIIPSLN
jgi:hypothetical protein